MEFSRRTQWDLTETPWARLLAGMRASGARLLDLTASNPTRCGLDYDASSILAPLNDPQALQYDPDPRGLRAAREAVCSYYKDQGLVVDPESLVLTTSTSEAYSFLFRLLSDPGDQILVASPSYPLLDFLAQLDDVSLTPYELFYDHGWQIDLDGLRRRLSQTNRKRARAIVVVHPNNPTGHFTRPEQRAALEEICREHGLALIVDEVFLDYACSEQGEKPGESFAAGAHDVLTFVLSGLSKVAALPQMKAAWIACFGDGREMALARLEVIADTFLSMNAPIQCALPAWLQGRHGLQRQIRNRIRRNLTALDATLATFTAVTRLKIEAGWYAVLRIPALAPDEEVALNLLTRRGVAVHPGYFFGFPEAGWLVVSLLPPEVEFQEGIEALVEFFR